MTSKLTSEQKRLRQSVVKAVAKEYNISTRDILGSALTRDISDARQMAMYILKTHVDFSMQQISEMLNRHPATIKHGIEKTAGTLDVYKDTKAHYTNIMEDLFETHKIGASATR